MNPNEVLENGRLSIDVGTDVSRRDVLKQVAATSSLLGTAGCLSDTDDEPAPAPSTETPGVDPREDFEFSKHPAVSPPGWEASNTVSGDGLSERRAVLVLQITDIPLYMPLIAGFHDALHQFGWTGAVRGPDQEGTLQGVVRGPDQEGTLRDQVDIIETEIGDMSAGDVLVTTILQAELYNDAIQSAFDNDIVVVNSHYTPTTRDWNYEVMREEIGFEYTSPVTDEDREMIVPHVGIRDDRGGVAMAAEMYERLQEQKPNQDEYTVFLVNDLPNNPAVTRRVNKEAANGGTAQRYFEAREDVAIYEDRVFTAPQSLSVSDSQQFVVDTIQGEEIDAVVASAFWSAIGAGSAVRAGELDEDMLVCAFDVAGMTGTPHGPIAAGEVDFVVGQDMYGQGYRSAEIAWTWLERGVPMKDLEWGVSVWDQDNVEFATQRRSWEDLLEWQRENYEGVQ